MFTAEPKAQAPAVQVMKGGLQVKVLHAVRTWKQWGSGVYGVYGAHSMLINVASILHEA